jgi:tRNA G18 (ribose-2'-O)-methylase SpoU
MKYVQANEFFNQTGVNPPTITHKPLVIADHLRTPENMGSLIRLADNVGASEVIFLGEAVQKASRIKYAAASSATNITWKFSQETDLRKIIPDGYSIVALETAIGATSVFTTVLPEKLALIVGNERTGISEIFLKQSDLAVYLPVPGPTRSLNVTHAAAVLLYEWLRQMNNQL